MPSRACSSTGNGSRPTSRRRCAMTVPLRDDGRRSRMTLAALCLGTLVGASALRRALSIVPVAIIGYAIAWFLYFEPSQNVTAKPVVEMKPEVTQAAAPASRCRRRRDRKWPRPSRRRRAGACAATTPVAPAPPRRRRRAAAALVEGRDQGAAGQARRGRFHRRADRRRRRAADPGSPAPLRPVAQPRQARRRRRRRCFGCARKPRPASTDRPRSRQDHSGAADSSLTSPDQRGRGDAFSRSRAACI